ncbi:MAG TPA: FIST N-terminal domain-containing protein [Gaiellaceae bacterium]|nr:FIST N-terminal domain-containing protein [Gaiellaceae bacterium]
MRPKTLTCRVGAGLSIAGDGVRAAHRAARDARDELGGAEVDLAFLFLSAEHHEDAEEALAAASEQLDAASLIGCVAEGVVGRDRELEHGPGAVVWAATLPGSLIETFHAVAFGTDEGVAVGGLPPLDDADLVTLLVDPFTFPASGFLTELTESEGDIPVVGGLAAGPGGPDAQALFLDDQVLTDGAVGVVLRGVRVSTVVSQGCAPVGADSVITSAEENVVYELAGKPALERLHGELRSMQPEQQQLAAQGGLLAGLVIDENRSEYGRGDYLMRGLLDVDEESGALTIGEAVRVGQTLRFHVRDARSADDDLREALAQVMADGDRAAGALLFTCNGRGTNMFSEPDHDAQTVADAIHGEALAGFFCAGEIGPVGGRPFLHGFTATLAVFLEN